MFITDLEKVNDLKLPFERKFDFRETAMGFVFLGGGSGSGKTTLAKRIDESYLPFRKLYQVTTREKRHDEKLYSDYFFMNEQVYNYLYDGLICKTSNEQGKYGTIPSFKLDEYNIAVSDSRAVKDSFGFVKKNFYFHAIIEVTGRDIDRFRNDNIYNNFSNDLVDYGVSDKNSFSTANSSIPDSIMDLKNKVFNCVKFNTESIRTHRGHKICNALDDPNSKILIEEFKLDETVIPNCLPLGMRIPIDYTYWKLTENEAGDNNVKAYLDNSFNIVRETLLDESFPFIPYSVNNEEFIISTRRRLK